MVREGDLILGGEHTIQHADDVQNCIQKCTPETYNFMNQSHPNTVNNKGGELFNFIFMADSDSSGLMIKFDVTQDWDQDEANKVSRKHSFSGVCKSGEKSGQIKNAEAPSKLWVRQLALWRPGDTETSGAVAPGQNVQDQDRRRNRRVTDLGQQILDQVV